MLYPTYDYLMFWEYFQKGGPIMYPLILFSVVALGLSLERFFYFLRLRVNVHQWYQKWFPNRVQSSQDVESSLADLKKHPLRQVLSSLCQEKNLPRKDLEALAQEESEEQLQYLERNLKTISVIAILSPLVGLLGTVMGIMNAFLNTSEAQKIDPTLLAGGIWEALITTFVGLSIAIPAWAIYYYFSHVVDRQIFLMEFFSSRFLRVMQQKGFLNAQSKTPS